MRFVLFTLIAALTTPAAFAQIAGGSDEGFELYGDIGVTHDRRDRGLALSDFDVSPELRFDLSTDSGVFGGLSGSYVDDLLGGDARIRSFVGYAFDADGFTVDASVNLDTFHGDGASRFFPEIEASVSRDFGLLYIRSGLVYAPDGRWFTPDNQSLYSFANLEIPVPTLPELTVIGHVGYDIRDGRADIADWRAGVSYFWRDFELTVEYIDSAQDGPVGNGRVVTGLRLYF